jgi:hypothetical protein
MRRIDPFRILPTDVLRELLIKCSSNSAGSSIASLFANAAKRSSGHSKLVYGFVSGILVDVPRLQPNYDQCLSVLSSVLQDPKQQRVALLGGLFDRSFALFASEVDGIRASERRLVLNMSVGLSAFLLTSSLVTFFTNCVLIRCILHRKRESVSQLLHVFFKL